MPTLLLVLIGLVTGMIGAMLGLGGSIILIPALNEVFGVRQHLYQSAAMIINFAVAVMATWRHHRAGVVAGWVIRPALPAAVLGVLLGVAVSGCPLFQGPQQTYLTGIFGLFMLAVALFNIGRLFRRRATTVQDDFRVGQGAAVKAALLVGAPTGFVAGLLGVGGGVIAIPLQQLLLRMPLRNAIGNSAAMMCGLSAVGAIYKNYQWWTTHELLPYEPLVLAAFLLPSGLLGSLLGSRWTHVLPLRWVQGLFVVVLVIGGLRQLLQAL